MANLLEYFHYMNANINFIGIYINFIDTLLLWTS